MIAVTGASGALGRLAVEALLERGVPADTVVAVVRSPEKVADLAAKGVQVRHGDYSQPETLAAALAGVERLLLVSGSEVGQRVAQHRNVVDAAAAAGVRQIAYTSILRADTSGLALAAEHKATEELIHASGLPFTFLRNGWYTENYTGQLAQTLGLGAIFGAAGDGVINAATRADFAAAAAAVLSEGHENKVYELGGEDGFTLERLAAEISTQTGKEIAYTDLPAEEYVKVLVGAGLPEAFAGVLADSDLGVARGELATSSRDLPELIGRPTTSLADAVADALKSL
jgi:NAD(P)H dehydrogenase (quinone)